MNKDEYMYNLKNRLSDNLIHLVFLLTMDNVIEVYNYNRQHLYDIECQFNVDEKRMLIRCADEPRYVINVITDRNNA